MKLSYRIKDKELCPCGSGKRFEECCKGRYSEIMTSRIPPDVQIMKKMRSSMKRICMHPDKENCKGKIKNAHALQNNKIVSLLAGKDRHVYMLDGKKQPLLIQVGNGEILPFVEISKVSANDATTETCFCDYHDNVVFASIEKGAPLFDPNSVEMKFLYAYKAFIFEYYKHTMSLDIFQNCFKKNPVAFLDDLSVASYRMLQMKMSELEPIKKYFDNHLLEGTYDGLYTCAIELPQQIAFADYAYIAPDYDMDGRKIRHTIKNFMHRLAITVFPEETSSWLLMSCLEEEKYIYEKLFNQAKEASWDKIKFYLNMVLPLFSENMVLSPKLWETWDEVARLGYLHFANLNGADAKTMSMAIGMGLRNAKNGIGNYDNNPKINLFAV